MKIKMKIIGKILTGIIFLALIFPSLFTLVSIFDTDEYKLLTFMAMLSYLIVAIFAGFSASAFDKWFKSNIK